MNLSLALIPSAYSAGKLYSVLPDDGTGDFTVSRNGTATYLGSDGLLKTAQANEPRLEFNPDGTFKGVLVEPAATNLLLRSEELNLSPWTILLNEVSVTPNSDISPNGTLTADRIEFLSGSTRLVQVVNLSINTTYTVSFYCRNINATQIALLIPETDIASKVSYFNQISTTQWNRVSVSFTTNSNNVSRSLQLTRDGNIGGSLLIWGVQLETGSVATSYIPTEGSTVTRPADVIQKTNAQDLIGQTEGSIYVEINISKITPGIGRRIIGVSDGSTSSRLGITLNSPLNTTIVKNSQVSLLPVNLELGKNKLLVSYNDNEISYCVNGSIPIKVSTDGSGLYNQIIFGSTESLSFQYNDNIKNFALFKIPLTDEQAIALTTL